MRGRKHDSRQQAPWTGRSGCQASGKAGCGFLQGHSMPSMLKHRWCCTCAGASEGRALLQAAQHTHAALGMLRCWQGAWEMAAVHWLAVDRAQ